MENNWTINQTKELFLLVNQAVKDKKGLNSAFSQMASCCGRSLNSVRNYYYSQLKMFELVPNLASDLGITIVKNQREEFEFFSKQEIDCLLKSILIGKAEGKSVRAIISDLACGDAKKALRLQNKYRSLITHHKDKIMEIMSNLAEQNIVYYNPYSKEVIDGCGAGNLQKLNEYISKLDPIEIGNFLTLIKKLV